nr:hypothetical protein [Tanacetum cinerariifolium]
RPTETFGGNRQHQRIEPEKDSGTQAGKNAAAVGLFPPQCAEHRWGQLGDRGKGDLANSRQTGSRTQQSIANIGQQKNDHDADPAHRQHPVAERFKRALSCFTAKQPRQQHVVGDHRRQRDTCHDDHASGRRGATDERQQGQRRVRGR